MLIALNIILLSVGFLFTKYYTQNEATSIKSISIFTLVDGVFGLAIFAYLSKFNISTSDIIYGVILSIIGCFNIVAQLKAYKLGELSVYTFFLMLGGMIFPTIYGKVFLSEEMLTIYYITIPLMVVCMGLSISPNKFKKSLQYYLICISVFVSNGLMSVFSKAYSINNTNVNSLLCVKYICESVFAIVLVIFSKKDFFVSNKFVLLNKKSSIAFACLTFACSAVAYFIQLLLLKEINATLFFPIQTAGVIFLTFVIGILIFKEKVEKRNLIFSMGILLSLILTIIFI